MKTDYDVIENYFYFNKYKNDGKHWLMGSNELNIIKSELYNWLNLINRKKKI